MEEELQLSCPQAEISCLGTMFKNMLSFFSYMDLLKNEDFSDGNTRFWHIYLNDYILTYSNENVTPALCNTFASMSETRLRGYKKFGGWNTIKSFLDVALDEEGLKKAINTIKKYSLLRKLNEEGYNVEQIIGHPRFNSLDAETIANLITGKISTICNSVVCGLDEPTDLSSGASNFIDSFFVTPSMGLITPWQFLNDYTLGLCPGDTMAYLSRSNSGKGRSISALCADLTLLQDATTYVIENEMDQQRWTQSVLCHCVNDRNIQKLTGCSVHVPEKRIVLSSYMDNQNKPLYRYHDKDGNFTESVEDYKQRVAKNSDEYQQVQWTMKYIEEHGKNKMFFKNVAGNYDDTTITRLMSSATMSYGADVICYDTCKSTAAGLTEGWSALQKSVTAFQECIAKLRKPSAILTMQMDRSAIHKRIEEITQDNIAMSSQVFHLCDTVLMWIHISPEDYKDYAIRKYDDKFAEVREFELDPKVHFTAFKLTKNRRGARGGLFLMRTNLDENTWYEEPGEFIVKKTRNEKSYGKEKW